MSILNSSKLRHRISSRGNVSRKRTRAGLLAVALGLTVTVVASPPSPKAGSPSVTRTAAIKHRWFQIGKASWYGGSFQGRKTANGERFDMNSLTCAHRSLPLGSWVRVTNLHNEKSVFLRVNDRGPVAESLILDLSYAAARKLGISGLGKVKVEEVAPNDPQMAQQLVAMVRPTDPPKWPVARGMGR